MTTPPDLFDLARLPRPFVLLEDRLAPGRPARLYVAPREVIAATTLHEVEPALARLEAALARGFHAAGFLAYEAGYAFEPKLHPLMPGGMPHESTPYPELDGNLGRWGAPTPSPLAGEGGRRPDEGGEVSTRSDAAAFAHHAADAAPPHPPLRGTFSHEGRRETRGNDGASPASLPLLWFGLFDAPVPLEAAALDAAFARLGPPPPIDALAAGHDRDTHVAAVDRILDWLHAGDTYQINLTFPLRFRWSGEPLAHYAALRAAQQVAHGGVVALDAATLVSVSPELFLRTDDRTVVTRPMKGTTARGDTPETDAAARDALARDPKQRAENLMIVDLLRNDLSRVAEMGSVKVPDLFRVETYPTLHTMTSTITARLRDGVGPAEVLAATFPCGSITGAPKHRAMEIIAELERAPRGVYTGSIGSIAPNGDLDLNVAIRTATLRADGTAVWGTGGGIVADSIGAAEYDEALLKARVLSDLAMDYGLIETLRFEAGVGFTRLELHLARLAASAAALGFTLDMAQLRADLAALVAPFTPADGARRVRIELARDGRTVLVAPPLAPEPDRPARVGLWPTPVDAGDPFLAHKTTKRARWNAASAEATRLGLDDMIFVNRDGFLTETTRANLFVERDDLLLTPRATHGLLPGVLRRELLEAGRAVEADLRVKDLEGATWWVGNSLRGMRRGERVG